MSLLHQAVERLNYFFVSFDECFKIMMSDDDKCFSNDEYFNDIAESSQLDSYCDVVSNAVMVRFCIPRAHTRSRFFKHFWEKFPFLPMKLSYCNCTWMDQMLICFCIICFKVHEKKKICVIFEILVLVDYIYCILRWKEAVRMKPVQNTSGSLYFIT